LQVSTAAFTSEELGAVGLVAVELVDAAVDGVLDELLAGVEELLLLPHPTISAAHSAIAKSVGSRRGFIGAPWWL
jgi:hypothetical protein